MRPQSWSHCGYDDLHADPKQADCTICLVRPLLTGDNHRLGRRQALICRYELESLRITPNTPSRFSSHFPSTGTIARQPDASSGQKLPGSQSGGTSAFGDNREVRIYSSRLISLISLCLISRHTGINEEGKYRWLHNLI